MYKNLTKAIFLVGLLSINLSLPAAAENSTLPEISTAQMEKVATKVLNELKMAKGILSTEPPYLKVRQFSGSIKLAVFYKDLNEIHLDSLSYEIMRDMGRDSLDALAFLLGHELGHYINKHKKVNHALEEASDGLMSNANMIQLSSDVENAEVLPQFEDRMNRAITDYNDTHDEAEADFEGGFLGYLAGYEPMNAGKKFLKRAYDHPFMNLTKNAPGYPSFDERLAVIEKTTEELQQLIPLFETATYLIAIQQYEDALPYLEKVLLKFESREIYNNIGVIHVMEILSGTNSDFTDYKFPLSLDASFRIPHPNFIDDEYDGNPTLIDKNPKWKFFNTCSPNEFQKKMSIAEDYFSKAINLDSEYANAYLNLSIAQSIKAKLTFYGFSGFMLSQNYDCSNLTDDEYLKAKANALQAKNIVEKQLAEYGVYLYSNKEDSSLYKVVHFDSEYAAKKIEPYPSIPFSSNWVVASSKIDLEKKLDVIDIPDKGYLLSNIYTQINLIHVLKNNLAGGVVMMNTIPSEENGLEPFTLALELNPDNLLALHNRSIATGKDLNAGRSSLTEKKCSSEKEKINRKDIEQWIEDERAWEIQDVVKSSRLNTKSDDDPSEFTKVIQHLRYSQNRGKQIYLSETSYQEHRRIESSSFVKINPVDRIKTNCDLKVGDHYNLLQETYGEPDNSVSFGSGSLMVYTLSKKRFLSYYPQDGDANAGIIRKEFAGNDLPDGVLGISKAENEEHGIMFRLNPNNEIKSWTIYKRHVLTE